MTVHPRARAAWRALALLALSAGVVGAQDELPEERAAREALIRARAAAQAAFERIEAYGRLAPSVTRAPLPEELRERGRARLQAPLEPSRQRLRRPAEVQDAPSTAQELAELALTRDMILARLRLLAPERYPEPDDPEAVAAEPAADEVPVTPRVLDVRDLVYDPEDHPGTNVGLGAGLDPGGARELTQAVGTPSVGLDAEKLLELVLRELGEAHQDRVQLSDGRLIVRLPQDVLARVEALLASLRRDRGGLVDLELRVYHMPAAVFASLRGASTAIGPDAERALAQAVAEDKATLVGSHRVVAHDGQLVNVRRGPQRAFVGDVEVDQTGVVPVMNPVTSVLNEGLMVEVRPIVDRARGRVLLDVSASLSRLVGKPETRDVKVDAGAAEGAKGIEIELPALDVARLSATTVVPLGQGALLGGVLSGGDAGPIACVIYVRPQLVRRPQ